MPGRGRPDVLLRVGRRSQFDRARRLAQLSASPHDWFECRRLADHSTYLRWSKLFEFLISADGRTIDYRRLEHATVESLRTYLLGQVLSFSLLSLGYEPLHATVVVIDGEAVAFLGDCGYGKSTLGAAFLARGFPMLTDDVLALEMRNGRWLAHPGPARVKLFPSVADKLLARGTGGRLNPDTSKIVLRLGAIESEDRAVPLRALYALPKPTRRSARVSVAPMQGQSAFLEIIGAAFNLIQVDRTRLENQFRMATQLVRDVPVRRLAYPRRLSALDAVCRTVIADARSLAGS